MNFDAATMHARDATHGWKAESGPASPRRIERIKDAREVCLSDAATCIFHFDDRFILLAVTCFVASALDADFDMALAFNRFNGVDDEIEHGVFYLRGINGRD